MLESKFIVRMPLLVAILALAGCTAFAQGKDRTDTAFAGTREKGQPEKVWIANGKTVVTETGMIVVTEKGATFIVP